MPVLGPAHHAPCPRGQGQGRLSRMTGQPNPDPASHPPKIAHLVKERGWNQEDFARIANRNRQTVRDIMQEGKRRLRNATVSACARALGLPVSDLRNLPLERLLPRMNGQGPLAGDEKVRRLYEEATQPELRSWIERNSERAKQLNRDEMDELLSLQGTGGPMNRMGVEHFVELI